MSEGDVRFPWTEGSDGCEPPMDPRNWAQVLCRNIKCSKQWLLAPLLCFFNYMFRVYWWLGLLHPSQENNFMCAHKVIDSKHNLKKQMLGLERWLSYWECLLLFQVSRMWFPEPPLGSTHPSITAGPGPPLLSSGFHRHPHKQAQQMLVDTHIHSYTKDWGQRDSSVAGELAGVLGALGGTQQAWREWQYTPQEAEAGSRPAQPGHREPKPRYRKAGVPLKGNRKVMIVRRENLVEAHSLSRHLPYGHPLYWLSNMFSKSRLVIKYSRIFFHIGTHLLKSHLGQYQNHLLWNINL